MEGNRINPGDTVSIPVTTKRKWWEWWKPMYKTEAVLFLVDSVSGSTFTVDRPIDI